MLARKLAIELLHSHCSGSTRPLVHYRAIRSTIVVVIRARVSMSVPAKFDRMKMVTRLAGTRTTRLRKPAMPPSCQATSTPFRQRTIQPYPCPMRVSMPRAPLAAIWARNASAWAVRDNRAASSNARAAADFNRFNYALVARVALQDAAPAWKVGSPLRR